MQQTKHLQPSKIKMSRTKIYSILFVAGILTAFATYYFIVPSHLYTPGLGGMSYGIAYVFNDIWNGLNGEYLLSGDEVASNLMVFWIVYGISNIPIIYLSLRWYSKKFFFKSMFYFFVNLFFTLIFSNVPGFNFLLLGAIDPSTSLAPSFEALSILFFAVIGGLVYGVGLGLVFSVGACTMGLDPITKYYSRERDMNIVPLLFLITIINTTLWTIVRFWTNTGPDNFLDPFTELSSLYEGSGNWEIFVRETILSPAYIGSWLFVAIYSMVTGSIYSSNKKVQIFITTKKAEIMSDYFNSIDYHRGHTLYEVQGGYTKEKRKSIQMITNIEEMYDVVEKVAAIDSTAFITVTELSKVYDVHDWRSMTEEDKVKAIQRIHKDKERKIRLFNARTKRAKTFKEKNEKKTPK